MKYDLFLGLAELLIKNTTALLKVPRYQLTDLPFPLKNLTEKFDSVEEQLIQK